MAIIKDRAYVLKNQTAVPVVFPPTTKCGLGKGRARMITFNGKQIPVRLHKYIQSVASDQYGNVYFETSGRVSDGRRVREWVREITSPS